jgi:polysaccharide biosynthesis/export protein
MTGGLKKKIIVAALPALWMLFWAGCETTVNNAPLPQQPSARTPVNLSPGDVVKISFTGAPDLNQSQKIRADGKVSLPLVGEVTAAGKTVLDFQNDLTRLYKSQLRNNEIVVTLESGIVQVVVSGAVSKPAKLTFDRPTTVFQAIMEAGGVNEYGSLRKVHLIRTIAGEQRTQVLDLRPALSGKTTSVLYVKDGDIVYVPQTPF